MAAIRGKEELKLMNNPQNTAYLKVCSAIKGYGCAKRSACFTDQPSIQPEIPASFVYLKNP
jgi:hypothetical protein